MYTDGEVQGAFGMRRKISGLPTLQFTASTVVKDVRKSITMDVKLASDLVYVLGKTKDELGGSEYYQIMNCIKLNVPQVDVEAVIPLYRALARAIQEKLIASCHAVGRGGLGVHLALVAMGGNLGMDVDLGAVPVQEKLSATRLLYSESAGRFIVSIDPNKKDVFEDAMDGLDCACAGRVRDDDVFSIAGASGEVMVKERVGVLKEAWKRPFGDLV
jgi:phosphoribosylformylglycinamidine synthase